MAGHMVSGKVERGVLHPLAVARGLGASHTGTEHWWLQRLTSIALVPLTLWFVFTVAQFAGAPYGAIVLWLKSPLNAGLLILFVAIGFHHAAAGLEVIFEDYIHHKPAKLTAILIQKFFFLVLGVVCVVSVLMVALGR